MKKNYFRFILLIFMLHSCVIFAQQKKYWSKIDEAKIGNTKLQRKFNVKKYQTFELQFKSIEDQLKNAPNKNTSLQKSTFTIDFPDQNGNMHTFLVKETAVLHPALAKKYPNNKTYEGVAVENKATTIRFNTNVLGLHAMIVDKDRNVQYIDPVSRDKNFYKIYARKDLDISNFKFQCFTQNYQSLQKSSSQFKIADDKKLRTYRLALAGTGEYSQFHINQADAENKSDAEKKEIVLAAMTTAITRVNAVFENDLAITMQLVPNNTDIIFLDPDTDPYTNDDGKKMLGENQTTCNNVIGSANYDIGHVLSTGGGGVASLGSTCINTKARGVTGAGNPTGDFFYFDFIAHEMGHQFGANHTFNGNTGSCSGNSNPGTSVEPGSGSTLMAYAGICSPQNVQEHSDLYFHVVSINEIWENISNGNGSNCGVATNLVNNLNAPIVDAGLDYIIPKSTAFKLSGTGDDLDNDPISFNWEQIDDGNTSVPPSSTDTEGPLYRSLAPTENNNRYFPALSTLLRGDISSKWEVTPSVSRDINFSLTVRDNNVEAGQTAVDDMKVTVNDAAGPFLVSSQNTEGLVWELNSSQTINWDVAGTDSNGINVSNVNIYMSTDGGKTFDTPLKLNTPNDGSEEVTAPNIAAFKCFVMVEAVNNIFFAVSQKAFSVGEFEEMCETTEANNLPKNIPDNNPSGVVSEIDIAADETISKVNVNVEVEHTWIGDLTIWLESPFGTKIKLIENQCFGSSYQNMNVTFTDSGDELLCDSNVPAIAGLVLPFQPLADFVGESSLGTWRLRVVDDSNQDVGTLVNWSIELCTAMPKLGVDEQELENLMIYPNPSNGVFEVSFRLEDERVEINLFDILGRRVKHKSFVSHAFKFNENIDFQGVASGLYILQIKNGNKISAKKVQIK